MGLGVVRLDDAVEVVGFPCEARLPPIRFQCRLGHAQNDDRTLLGRKIGVEGNGALGYAENKFLLIAVGKVKILNERTA